MSFKLSATLSGHSSDVRGLAAQGSDVLVSVSRDKTARVWRRVAPNDFAEDAILVGHEGFVNSVAIIPPTSSSPSGLIATGGSDKNVFLWDPTNLAQPLETLRGHTSNVCTLSASKDGKVLVSGSWDTTAKVWMDGQCKYTLRGHQQAVWSVLVMDDGSILTASADKVICRWNDGSLVRKYEGHTDCVRALVALPDGRFASAANDSSVRIWSLDGSCDAELYGHSSFVYTLDVLPNGAIISGGEDRSIRVWQNNEAIHVILVPSTSVWAVAALDNGDIACGTSDGRIRVFSTETARLASPEALMVFEAENSAFVMSKKTMSDVDTSKLPGPERLEQPGTKDQQIIMVKSGTIVEAFQWDQGAQKWSKVGEVVDAAGQTQKAVFDGKEYDYVFDVDITEGAPPLKLPYNVTDNPYTAAQKFLERNEISMDHLDTVANFIIKNADGVQLGTGNDGGRSTHSDPFTGGNRYMPTQSAGQGGGSSGYADPFTGGGRYVPANSGGQGNSSNYNPPSEYVINRQGNGTGIFKKLVEFNQLVAQAGETDTAGVALDDTQLQALEQLSASIGTSVGSIDIATDTYDALLISAVTWPKDKRFPSLDLLRLVVAGSPVPIEHTFTHDGRQLGFVESVGQASGFFELFESGDSLSKSDEINLMMGVRALSNAFAHVQGGSVIWDSRVRILEALDGSWIKAINKNLMTALSNLYLNMAIVACKKGDDDQGLNILSAASRFLSCTDNADAQLRLVSVFGVLAAKFQLCKDSARVLGDEMIVVLGIQGKSDGVRRAAKELGAFLSA
ncbi:WD repeat protein Lub1 [Coemansia interrupta]|uniref:WD repeat protein Lub1 n=1 Tax=Coemansia interrupta TaxID=1126814 RepID=A0A9W8HL20_9FUNG|nr:WD repeat protein Lub1 [Coemansia interrupta]